MRLLSILLLIGYNACGQCPCVSSQFMGIVGQSNAGSPCGVSTQTTQSSDYIYNVFEVGGSSDIPTTYSTNSMVIGTQTGNGGNPDNYDSGVIAYDELASQGIYEGLFKYSVGGTCTCIEAKDDWSDTSSGELLDKFCFYYDVAIEGYEGGIGVMNAMVWNQGERDIILGQISGYSSRAFAIFQEMWNCVGYNFEVIVVKIGDNASNFTTTEITDMQNQQDQLCGLSPFITCIEYPYDYCDGIHHSNNGVIQLGNDIANILSN